MAEISKIKYTQYADFRDKLTNSKGYLAHNVRCSFWGTGPDGVQVQVQSGYLVTSASRHLTKDYIYTRAQQSLKV